MDKALQRQSFLFSFLLCGVFILAPFYSQQSPGGEGLAIPYNNWVWIAAILLICSAVFQIILKKDIILPSYWLGMAALPLGFLISGFINESVKPTQWLFRIGYVIGGYLFFIALFQFKLKRRLLENILYGVCAAATLHSLIALSQILNLNLGSYIPRTAGNYPISIFQQVNVHASYLTSAFFIALYLASSPSIKTRQWCYKLLLVITILATTTMLLAISSRTTLVAISVSLPILLIARYPAFNRNCGLSALLLCAFVLGIASGGYLSKGFAKYETKLDVQRQHARTYIYDLSWQTFKQAPLFGHGLGSFEQVFQEAKIDYPQSDKLGIHRFSHPHNELLFWMIEGGVTALSGIFIALAATILALFKLGWRRAFSYCALLFPISFHTQVELPFYLSSALWFLWLTLLFLIHQHRNTRYKVIISAFTSKFIIISSTAISAILIGFFLHVTISLKGIVDFVRSPQLGFSTLQSASQNLYFQDLSVNLTLTRLLYIDIALGTKTRTPEFIIWAEQYIIKHPVTSTMADLALAYFYMGDRVNALSTIRRAAKMYPVTPGIIDRLQDIESDRPIAEFRQKIQTRVDRSQAPATP